MNIECSYCGQMIRVSNGKLLDHSKATGLRCGGSGISIQTNEEHLDATAQEEWEVRNYPYPSERN